MKRIPDAAILGRLQPTTGIDFIEEAINRARCKASERGVQATFLVKDAMTLKEWTERFDTVIDSGLFPVFSNEDRRRYVEGLAAVLKSGGRLFLMCFSDEEPGTQGPKRVSKKEPHDAFAEGWSIEFIEPAGRRHGSSWSGGLHEATCRDTEVARKYRPKSIKKGSERRHG